MGSVGLGLGSRGLGAGAGSVGGGGCWRNLPRTGSPEGASETRTRQTSPPASWREETRLDTTRRGTNETMRAMG